MSSKNRFALTKTASYVGYVIQAIVNNLLSLLFVVFNAEPYSISIEKLGRLVLFNFFAQLIIDYLSIYIIPRLGYKRCVIFAQFSSAIGFLLLGVLPRVIDPYFGILIATFFLATGSGFIEVLISPIIEALPSNNKAGSMSFLHSFYSWGQIITVVVTTFLILFLGRECWYYIPLIWSIVPFVNTFLFYKSEILELKTDENQGSLSALLKNKSIYKYMLFMFCAGASEITMVQWSSFFVEICFGVEKWMGDMLGPCMFALLMGLGRMGYGIFGKKLPLERLLIFSSVLCFACYLMVAFSRNGLVCAVGCALCGLSVSVMWPGIISLSAEKFKSGGSSVFSVMAMFGDIGCAVGPWVLGLIAEISVKSPLAVSIMKNIGIRGVETGMQFGFLICSVFPLMMLLFFIVSGIKTAIKRDN